MGGMGGWVMWVGSVGGKNLLKKTVPSAPDPYMTLLMLHLRWVFVNPAYS